MKLTKTARIALTIACLFVWMMFILAPSLMVRLNLMLLGVAGYFCGDFIRRIWGK